MYVQSVLSDPPLQVGSGKSALLSALLGDMTRTRGLANVRGRVAYVPQQAWIQNSSLRENITFGKKFNAQLYQKVCRYYNINATFLKGQGHEIRMA